ncbi:MAG: DnaB-like helicase C-terminal domain-containing protein [Candidatus Acidiferrales bacterium]
MMAPESVDVEMAVLAAISSDRYLLEKVLDEGFHPQLLHSATARLIAETLAALREQSLSAVDLIILKSKLEDHGQFSPQVKEYLEGMTRIRPPRLDQLLSYVDLLKDRQARERLLKLGVTLESYAKERQPGQAGFSDLAAGAVQELLDIQRQRMRKQLRPVGDLIRTIVSESKQRPKGQKILLGYSLAPFERLTQLLSGLRPGFYYGLAGAPRRGKTNLGLHLASNIAKNHHIPVLFYSWEQTRRVLTARLLAKESGINPTTMLTEDIESAPGGLERLAKGLSGVHHYDREVFVLEGSRKDTVDRIRSTAYNLMHDFRTDSVAIFLDYLQKVPLAHPPADARARIDEISTALADLSLELNCPVLAISSIDKEGCRLDEDPGPDADLDDLLTRARPTMHHCTGSGDIEYDLDVAMILSKDWAATLEFADLLKTKFVGDVRGGIPKIDILNLSIDKNRDAPDEASQAVQYAFFIRENKFVELDFKSEDESRGDFRGFARAQEIFDFLVSRADISARTTIDSR